MCHLISHSSDAIISAIAPQSHSRRISFSEEVLLFLLVQPRVFVEFGVRKVELDELLQTADFVSPNCPLNEQTRGLIGAEQLSLMKHDAYLLNLARGGIVDEAALYDALASGNIAGAALDCFENEPVVTPHSFGELDNVLLAPHSIAWTDELFRDIGRTACQGLVELSEGRRPLGVVNSEVLDCAEFNKKWDRIRLARNRRRVSG